jgi:hypothetical protein
MKTPALILRLEVYEQDHNLVYVAEKPLYSKTNKAIQSMHTRLINWAQRQYPEWREINVRNSLFDIL